jgi:cysteine desulfurase / selenocysteine lyase
MIYLDHSATSLPKDSEITKVYDSYPQIVNPGRSGYGPAVETSRLLYESRLNLAKLLNLQDESGIVFTQNATLSLNIILNSISKIRKVIGLCSSREHNAVMRPLHYLKAENKVDWVNIKENNENNFYKNLENHIHKNIDFVVLSHVCNVTGRRLDLQRVGEITKKYDCLLIVDAAQSFGCEPIDMNNIDILCASAHKGLRGPMGLGILAINTDKLILEPLYFGGTGSSSTKFEMPQEYPDRLEAGTLNVHSIIATGNICSKLNHEILGNHKIKLQDIRTHLITELSRINSKIKVYAPIIGGSAISIDIAGVDIANVSHELWVNQSICTRVGLHCSPFTHQQLGTFPNGTLRISPAHDTKQDDLDILINALKKL